MQKFKKGDKVLIFNCPECVGGSCGLVLDKDVSEPEKPAYLILDTFCEDEMTRWVKPENMQKLNFEKPKTMREKIKGFFRKCLN